MKRLGVKSKDPRYLALRAISTRLTSFWPEGGSILRVALGKIASARSRARAG